MNEELTLPQLQGTQGLEQFLLLAKTAKGAAAAQLIQDVTNSTGVYVFGELLECENIQALEETEYSSSLQLLKLFTYGTYSDYKQNTHALPQLSPTQLTKLKHLTVITLAAKNRTISYSTLLDVLDISNVRELEDLIIEAIYHNILQAKLDQCNHQLEVESFIGRDIQSNQLDGMIDKLEQWCTNCAAVIQIMENEIIRANEMKSDKTKQKESLEQEIKSLRQAVAVATTDLNPSPDFQDTQQHKLQKKGLRGSLARGKS